MPLSSMHGAQSPSLSIPSTEVGLRDVAFQEVIGIEMWL